VIKALEEGKAAGKNKNELGALRTDRALQIDMFRQIYRALQI
jgi:hypothetical protein